MDNIVQLLTQPESRTLEFKRDLSSLRRILITLIAFANTSGGTLVVGCRDDGRLCGVDDVLGAEERLASAMADGIEPSLLPDLEIRHLAGVALLVVRVARWPGPFFLKSLGPEKGVYVRLGSTNRRADPRRLEELRSAARRLDFDQLPCPGTTLDDLDLAAAKRLFAAAGRQVDEAKLEGVGVLCRYGSELVPSNGGLILFGDAAARQLHFPNARIRCARFLGSTKAEFLDRLEPEGTMLEALEQIPRFIRRNTRLAARIEGMRRRDIAEYPAVALREALVNAIAHADYGQHGMQIQLAIYSDRLEIQSPGTLPFPLTLDDFEAGVSRIRNPVIARVLRELGHMEEWGSGYLRMTETCADGGYPQPEWEELGAALRVTFRPHPAATEQVVGAVELQQRGSSGVEDGLPEDLSERQAWFLERLREREEVSPRELVERFGISLTTAKRDVAELRDRGLVAFIGPPRGGVYHLVEAGEIRERGYPYDAHRRLDRPLNARQRWFLDGVRRGYRVRIRDLAERFGVASATAKRDVAELRRRGLVTFVGPPRTGAYRWSRSNAAP